MTDKDTPTPTVWGVVTTLELRYYTRKEIYDSLIAVAEAIRPPNGFEQ